MMKNELSLDKSILKRKNNDWSILNLLWSYLKHNRSIIISIFLLPLIFIVLVFVNYETLMVKSNGNIGSVVLMILWLTQTASFTIQTFLVMMLDLKQSIIYRRICLTQVTKIKFILITSVFNLILLLITDIFIFLVVLILSFSLNLTSIISTIFNWQLLLIIIFTIALSIMLTGLAMLMTTIIKSRTGQTIASVITNLLIIFPLMSLVFFIQGLSNSTNYLTQTCSTTTIIGIFSMIILIINFITFCLYYVTWRWFKWFE